MFPAQALAEALTERGWRVVLATDERGAVYADRFPAEKRIALSAATYRNGDPIGMARAGIQIARGVMQARSAFKVIDPAIVVGFGGYPSLPALLAALSAKRPAMIHEQNAVLGRVNRLLAPRMQAIASAFPTLEKASSEVLARTQVVGNPVRPEISALFDQAYEAPTGDIRLLITGGSQGARILSELIPEAIARLPEALRYRLKIQQQTRKESLESARQAYAEALVDAEIAPFFRDMAGRLSSAHLVIGRAGASTVSELAAAGRPSLLIPLKIAMDDHQRFNAKLLTDVGAAMVLAEDDATVEAMASLLERLLTDPEGLTRMAKAAHAVAIPDGAARLADLVEQTAGI
jgi:UDP-N-acetylglucosamine--N-acetylmuramyl-(pentapeptide) pyrophosphoryl-undecaprenol N-acetylglucosamine transferase